MSDAKDQSTIRKTPLTLAAYNIEWFDALFDKHDRLVRDGSPSERWRVTKAEQADAVAAVMKAVDADAMVILEAPNDGSRSKRSTVDALEGFARHYDLRQNAVLHGFRSPTHQEIALLYDRNRLEVWHDPLGEPLDEDDARRVAPVHVSGRAGAGDAGRPFPGAPRFDGVFPWDVDGDGVVEIARFSKPPLEIGLHDLTTGRRLRAIGAHLKSKNPGRIADAAEKERVALENRRKHLGQCAWLRARIDEHIAVGEPVLVLGDFNDGPGLDRYETRLGRSGLETIVGEGPRAMVNPFLNQEAHEERLSTTRFWRSDLDQYLEALLDFALVSPDLAQAARPSWKIWHPFNTPDVAKNEALAAALLRASDHFPVSVTLN